MWYLGPLTISIAFCFFLHMGHTFPFLYMYYNFFFLENWHFINLDVLRCFNCVWFFVEPVNSNLPICFVHGILQARILEWVATSYSRESSWPRDPTCLTFLSCICRQVLYHLLLLCSNLETDFSTFSICYAAVYLMYFLLLSNHNKLGGLDKFIISLFGGQKLRMVFHGLKPGWQLGCFPSGDSREGSVSYPFLASLSIQDWERSKTGLSAITLFV